MKMLSYTVSVLSLLLLTILVLFMPTPSYAADLHTGEQIMIPATQKPLTNPYLFGKSIQIASPVQDDLTAAGENITIQSHIQGSAIVAGKNIHILGTVGNNVRVAGGDIIIDGPITHDLVVAGGIVTVTKKASIGGDVLFAGGQLNLQGPVTGKVMVQGGNVTINAPVGQYVSGEVKQLTLGPQAAIHGNLSYTSPQRANLQSGARIAGQTTFTQTKKQMKQQSYFAEFLTVAGIYKLLAAMFISVLMIQYLGRFVQKTLTKMAAEPVKNTAIGFVLFLLTPIAATLLITLLWLGAAAFLLYGLFILTALFLAQIFSGWYIMRWWEGRNNRTYRLDWKAGIVGPIVITILVLIPIIGWLAVAFLFLMSFGAFAMEMKEIVLTQKLAKK